MILGGNEFRKVDFGNNCFSVKKTMRRGGKPSSFLEPART